MPALPNLVRVDLGFNPLLELDNNLEVIILFFYYLLFLISNLLLISFLISFLGRAKFNLLNVLRMQFEETAY